jgi:hypothetical protein
MHRDRSEREWYELLVRARFEQLADTKLRQG